MTNLAVSYRVAGRTQEALTLREETLQLQKAKFGPDHPDTLTSMTNLAISYAGAGRSQEALKLFKEALQLRKAKLGPGHPSTLASMVNLANCYGSVGRVTDAIKLSEEALPVMKAKMPDHPFTFNCVGNLAGYYNSVGRHADALKLREEALALRKAKLGPDHPHTLSNMSDLAWSLASFPDLKIRDPQRAVDLAAQAVAGDPKNADPHGTLGTARYRTGDWKGAIADLEQAIRLRKPDDGRANCWGFCLAMAYWQVGDKGAAREWFDKAVAEMEQGQHKDDADLKRFRAEAAELLGRIEKP
jgi:tetratricopeptide (TPR) repeat protein